MQYGDYLFSNNLFILIPVDDKIVDDVSQSGIKEVAEKAKPYVCGDYKENSNLYMVEFLIPSTCSQPLGLAVDSSNKIWIAAN